MTFEEIKALDHQYVMQSYGRFDVAVDHGRGATLWDTQGREYIDFTSGIGVCSLGYADEGWVNAITEQAGKLGHISNLFYAEPYVKAAEKLCRKAGMSNVFFANSGAESNEGLIKLARKYSFDKYGKGRGTIITLHKSFHGRTITTLSATGQDVFHNYFFPFTEGFRHADANDFDSVEAMAGHDVCAVMFELIQGEGGVLPLDREFVQKVADLCAKRDWLLLIDEVQTGVGRTGSLFAFQQYGIQPDAVSFAKGIASNLRKKSMRKDTVDKALKLESEIQKMCTEKGVDRSTAKHAILRGMGFASGKRKEAFQHIAMTRSAELQRKAQEGDRGTIKILEDMGLSQVEDAEGRKTFSLQAIAEMLGMDSDTSWQHQMEDYRKKHESE